MTETADTSALACEIISPSHDQGVALAAIALVCARDLGQALRVRRRRTDTDAPALLVLHLPATLAAAQHPVWCLACRLACFCPDARVSVQVSCRETFAPARPPRRKPLPRVA
jgi:hypothetical protein